MSYFISAFASPSSTGEWYRFHGDERPQQSELEERLEIIDRKSPLTIQLIAADMCIDLAMSDTSRCEEHLAASKRWLNGVINQALWTNKKDPGNFGSQCGAATDAILKRQDLAQWRQAALGEEIDISFLGAFKAFMFSQQFGLKEPARMSQLEFVPVLLGARAMEANKDFGYIGRLSLFREDNRQRDPEQPKANSNWDCGVFLGPSIADFATPTRKLQIKNRNSSAGKNTDRKRASNYARGGVMSISATAYGFSDTTLIREVCVAELKALGEPDEGQTTVHDSDQVDNITSRLFNRYHEPIVVH